MDALSDALRIVRLTGAVFFDVHARPAWAVQSPASPAFAATLPECERIFAFHFLLEGSAWGQILEAGSAPFHLAPGQAVIVTGGREHVMSSAPGMSAAPRFDLYRRRVDQRLPYVLATGPEAGPWSGPETRLSCGFLGFDARPFNPVLEALPALLVVDLDDELVRMALAESEATTPGGETILARMSELLFLQAIRQHLATLPEDATGWLSGLRDRHVGAALSLMHARPAARWTLDGLAHEVGLSRTVFAERFAAIVGLPAMQYLATWRLQRAAFLMEAQGLAIAEAAAEVGYESEAAFSRAFRKRMGMPPGEWRRRRGAATEGGGAISPPASRPRPGG